MFLPYDPVDWADLGNGNKCRPIAPQSGFPCAKSFPLITKLILYIVGKKKAPIFFRLQDTGWQSAM
jgi:hypothetical protein